MAGVIRVLVAEDQAMVRTGFGMILGAESDIEVCAAVTGDALISPSITVRLLQHMKTPAPQQPHKLSSRELDVVKLAAVGKTNAEIAAWAWETRLVGRK
ncbi:response regulator transcription factor [Lentzea sp. NPDC055074]